MLVKFCGMSNQATLDLAAELGVDFCGFIFHGKSPRNVAAEAVAGLNTHGMYRTGVFVKQDAAQTLEIMRQAKLDFAQLHGRQDIALARAIGPERVIRVLWPQSCASVAELVQQANIYANSCAYYLLDSGQTAGGGTGLSMDWHNLADLELPHPFFLAGGLNAQNALAAIAACRPYALDFNSGLEDAPGVKNPQKMLAVMDILEQFGKLLGAHE